MGAIGHGMDFLASRGGSAQRLGRWRLFDFETLPPHHDDDFEWMRDAGAVAGRCHAIAGALARTHRAALKTVRRAIDDHGLERWMGQRELDLLQVVEDQHEIDEHAMQRLLVDIAWRREAPVALLWTLRLVDELVSDKMYPKQLVSEKLAPRTDPAGARAPAPASARGDRGDARLLLLPELARPQRAVPRVRSGTTRSRRAVLLERRRAREWLFQDVPWEEVDLSA